MIVSVDVYTKDLDAGLNAYKKAMESGAHDIQLNSSHDYESKELEHFNSKGVWQKRPKREAI